MKKRYVIVGASSRGFNMYALPLTTELKDYADLVGVFDINSVRANYVSQQCGGVSVYQNFDVMLKESKPDVVIVTTIDRFHHEYITRALDAGCDVITEKPMTIDAEKTRAIFEAEKRTGKKVIVTFNVRFDPYVSRIKELIRQGAVGEIYSMDLEWFLDTSHGADYFRRWHRYIKNSGSLLIHKASHHFDMINWWMDDDPEELYAFGNRRFYGPTRENRGERCLTCPYNKICEFFWDITSDTFTKKFYLDAEKEDQYFRDRCVFADDIDIYDTMSINIKYERGALLSYSLVAHSPYEGWKVSINGSDGRLEAENFQSGQRANEPESELRIYNRKGEVVTYHVPKRTGTHGGSDERLRRMIFVGDIPDPFGQHAGSWAGAMSCLIGAAANISIAEKKPVIIKDLLK